MFFSMDCRLIRSPIIRLVTKPARKTKSIRQSPFWKLFFASLSLLRLIHLLYSSVHFLLKNSRMPCASFLYSGWFSVTFLQWSIMPPHLRAHFTAVFPVIATVLNKITWENIDMCGFPPILRHSYKRGFSNSLDTLFARRNATMHSFSSSLF